MALSQTSPPLESPKISYQYFTTAEGSNQTTPRKTTFDKAVGKHRRQKNISNEQNRIIQTAQKTTLVKAFFQHWEVPNEQETLAFQYCQTGMTSKQPDYSRNFLKPRQPRLYGAIDFHDVFWNVHKLIHQTLAVYFCQDSSLVVVPIQETEPMMSKYTTRHQDLNH